MVDDKVEPVARVPPELVSRQPPAVDPVEMPLARIIATPSVEVMVLLEDVVHEVLGADHVIAAHPAAHFPEGPYIKDVRTEGGGGVCPKADVVRKVAWIYSYKSSQNADKGGEGVQKGQFFADVLIECPQRKL